MNWYDRLGRWSDTHRSVVDILATALALLVAVPISAATGYGEFLTVTGDEGARAAVVTFAVIAPLAVRRTHPVLSVVLVYAAALGHQLIGIPLVLPADLAVLVAMFSVTVYGPRWAHRVAIGAGLAGCLLLGILVGVHGEMVEVVVITVMLTAPMFLTTWAFGLVRRARRDTINALRDRALRLEVERDQQALIATAAERARIAREMHDIVAHSLSVMIAQADGGRYTATADPEAATRTLGTIAETGRAALADMRRLLGVLRTDPQGGEGADGALAPGEPGAAAADRTPQPAASDIEGLVAQVRASGLRISLVRMGAPRTLPPGTGLTLYRICQESLTNILKHAGPDPTVTVVLTWGPTSVQLQVDDDGRGASAGGDGGGQGLVGMRERAAMFAGTVASGPRPGGGFRVMLDLPLPEQRP